MSDWTLSRTKSNHRPEQNKETRNKSVILRRRKVDERFSKARMEWVDNPEDSRCIFINFNFRPAVWLHSLVSALREIIKLQPSQIEGISNQPLE